MRIGLATKIFISALAGVAATPTLAAPPGRDIARTIDLSKPFGARQGWRFIASQGPDAPDPVGEPGDMAPGVVMPCVSPDGGRTCRPALDDLLRDGREDDPFARPHFLDDVRIVHPRPDLPLLLLKVSSLRSANGDQRIATTALAYDRAKNTFVRVYARLTGRNNNQEVRYIGAGPLRGAIVSAVPTGDAPFGFWMTIDRVGADDRYRPVLRYRSQTRYGDGNPLAVIDSEMPEIQRRLGLWRPGASLPLPAGPCPQPRLIGRVLWCSARPAQ